MQITLSRIKIEYFLFIILFIFQILFILLFIIIEILFLQ